MTFLLRLSRGRERLNERRWAVASSSNSSAPGLRQSETVGRQRLLVGIRSGRGQERADGG
ncbi:uncharacterized protein PHACADRAFT_162408 [Phanerochaete carnosa HHB-10118-sp]|uniref:Uncharacterized protein n=1 Tax=Phanerochaete carnosa (strain HHB-10118-sp) TaxID=650164 RepID=K5W510_PHACS|nr:uncharacterized protein PHACADRAFT_162408 [Phanerochaete carnosa HHB-10118-sp]EKM54029.1 hypothetical protein PHACADRAFT_162408 [Phanerochaete carnosa HHB-10118-sp]